VFVDDCVANAFDAKIAVVAANSYNGYRKLLDATVTLQEKTATLLVCDRAYAVGAFDVDEFDVELTKRLQ
jgi:hypothetical protein